MWKMQSSAVSYGANEVNEDAAYASEDFIFVLDGATGLIPSNIMDYGSDAAWLSNRTADILRENLARKNASIADIVTEAMELLRSEWRAETKLLPSCGLSILRLNGDVLEYFGLGDCYASVLYEDGSFQLWEDEDIKKLDHLALKEMMELSENRGISLYQARELISETLLKHRAMKNREEGYWCLEPLGQGITRARTAILPVEGCESLFLCTDGYFQLVEFGALRDLRELHLASNREDLHAMVKRLYAYQEADKSLKKLPRFKFRDDASAARAILRRD